LAQLLFDLAGHREAVGLLLGEDQLVVDGDLEDASAAPDQIGLDAEPAFNLRRQTGGARIVVSHRAVFDAHVLHAALLSWTIVVQTLASPAHRVAADLGPTLYLSVEERNERNRVHVRAIGAWQGRNVTSPTNFPGFSRWPEYNRDCSTIALFQELL
jgi:hypothetical protein